MEYLEAKMHQIRFRPGLCTDPTGVAYSAPSDSLAGLHGPASKRKRRREDIGEGSGGEGRERKGKVSRERTFN